MCAKQRGEVPSYDLAKALCPRATTNDGTHATFSRQASNELLTTECYDDTPDKPWVFRFGCKRRALSKQEQEARTEWGTRLRRENLPATWFLNTIIWLNICAKVIPGNPKKALDQQRTAETRRTRMASANEFLKHNGVPCIIAAENYHKTNQTNTKQRKHARKVLLFYGL